MPYELNQGSDRAEICIGTDDFHTPMNITQFLVESFSDRGFSVSINEPFSGAVVPMKFYRNEASVSSVMIEIRRDIYMNEQTGRKTDNFIHIKDTIQSVISEMVFKSWV